MIHGDKSPLLFMECRGPHTGIHCKGEGMDKQTLVQGVTNMTDPSTHIYQCFVFFFFKATGMAYGSSQARGQIRAVAAGLRHNHSNSGSKLCLPPTPQLTAMLDP